MKKPLALAALALVFLLGAAFQSPNSVPGQLAAIQSQISGLEAQVASLANKGPRKFYLTRTQHNGAQALSACAGGYHMASLWEIHDPSNLRYNTELGLTDADSGFGPPNLGGWMRTGSRGFVIDSPGLSNCNAWTEADPGKIGSHVTLTSNWGGGAPRISPWIAFTVLCASSEPVWCVED